MDISFLPSDIQFCFEIHRIALGGICHFPKYGHAVCRGENVCGRRVWSPARVSTVEIIHYLLTYLLSVDYGVKDCDCGWYVCVRHRESNCVLAQALAVEDGVRVAVSL